MAEYYLTKQLEATKNGDMDEALRFSKRTVRLSQGETLLAVKLLNVMGLEYYLATNESDKVLAHLTSNISDSYCMTNDSDVLAHGSPNMFMKVQGNHNYEYLNSQEVLDALNIDRDQFVKLCILLGTDYNSNIKGMGWVRALKWIRQNSSFDEICGDNDNEEIKNSVEHFKAIEQVFKEKDNVNFERVESKTSIDYDAFNKDFVETHTFSTKRVQNLLTSLGTIEKCKQKLGY